MLFYDITDLPEGIDVNETSASKECDPCHYWYILNCSFKPQPNVCNRCHDLLMMSISLNNIAILNIKGSDCCCIISLISKNKTKKLVRNTDLTGQTLEGIKNLFSYTKMVNEISTFDTIGPEVNFTIMRLLLLRYVDIGKVLVSSKISFGEKSYKYFVGYLYNGNKIEPLNIMLPKIKTYDGQTKWIYFLNEDDDLLEKYNTVFDKVMADIKNEFDSKPVSSKN